MKRALLLVPVLVAGCARTKAAPAKAAAEQDVTYEMRGPKVISRTEGVPPAPVFGGAGLRIATPAPGAELPSFGGETRIPAALPAFVGSAIPGPDGIAPQTADKVVLLALLQARRFADLDRSFEDFQTAFELDPRKEYWPSDALDAFRTGDPGTGTLVAEWTAASPKSWAALAARGAHRHALAWLVRGGGFASSVSEAARREFARQEAEAEADLRAAVARRPRFVAAHAVLIAVRRGTPQARAVLDEALKACPTCFQPRSAYLDGLTPEWGGSYEKMDAFVRESLATGASERLKLLAGFAPYSRALKLRDDARPVEAMAEINAALKAGDLWRVYLVRANIANNLGQSAEALADLDHAFELKPQAAPLADYRGAVRARLGMLEGAIADFDLASRLDPGRPRPAEAARVADELVKRSNAAMADGGTERAATLRALANSIKIAAAAPGAPTPAAEASPTVTAYADPTAAFQAQLASLPDDYAAYRRAALPLLNAHRSDQLDELWTAWIQRHPEDPRGYFGRYAADSQKHDVARGDDDLRQACALGLADACRTQEINAAARGRASGAP